MIDPLRPRFPERICWGCDRRCPANDMACGEDKSRARHPTELCGEDWFEVAAAEPPPYDHSRDA